MIVVTFPGSDRTRCIAQFWKTHYGHSQEIKTIQIDASDNNDTLHADINNEERENIIHIYQRSVQYNTTANNYNNVDIFSQIELINILGTTRTYSVHQKYLINKHLAKILKIMNEGNKVQLQPFNNVNN